MINYSLRYLILCLIYLIITSFNVILADEMYYPVGTNPLRTTAPFAGQTIYPMADPVLNQYGIDFYPYNDGSGRVNLNLSLIPINKVYYSSPVVSPDLNNIIYTQVEYYPNNDEVVSNCYYVPVILPEANDEEEIKQEDYFKSYQVRASDQVRYKILSVGSNLTQRNLFKTLTVVDWSYDSNRAIIKEHIGQMRRGIVGSIVWVYDVREDKLYRIDTVRRAIINYWKQKKNLDLNKYIWDIRVLGWEIDSNNRFVVNAYMFPTKQKKIFLGCWSINVQANLTQLLSLDDENWNIGRYGLLPDVQQ